MAPEDADVAARFLAGEAAALETMERLLRAAARPYRDRLREQWDDLLQDLRAELTGLLRRREFRHESGLRTYLWRVVNNTCIERLRLMSRRRETATEFLEPADGSPSPLARVLRAESGQRLAAVLARTPVECRRLWGMILEGLNYAEMSRRLGARPGALRVRVLRCRRRAVALLQEAATGQRPER